MVVDGESFPRGISRLNGHNDAVGCFDQPEDAAGNDWCSRRLRP